MFLTKSELKTVADVNLIDKITNLDDGIVDAIIQESTSLMQSYLQPRYDTQAIFSATGTQRHLTVLKYLKDIVIYEIYIRHTRQTNEVALQRQQEAMRWLEKINKGEFSADLPLAGTEENSPLAAFGGNTRYTSHF